MAERITSGTQSSSPIRSWLGPIVGVFVRQKRYLDAARCYAEAAQIAQADGDGILATETARMQAWCLDRANLRIDAINVGLAALSTAQLIDAPLRSNCNLPLLVSWLFERVGPFHDRRGELERELHALYGEQWRDSLRPGDAGMVSARLAESEKQQAGATQI